MVKNYLIVLFVFWISLFQAQSDSTASNVSIEKPVPVKEEKEKPKDVAPPSLGEVFKPKISLGIGMLSYHGDLYSKHYLLFYYLC